MNDWESQYAPFYREAETYSWLLRKVNDGREEKNLILYHDRKTGSYSRVYPTTFDENGNKIAMKVLKRSDRIDQISLFAEYTIHKALYDKYIECGMQPRCVKPLWLRFIKFNGGHRVLCFGMEIFDETLYEHLVDYGKEKIMSFKDEIVNELKRLNVDWNFFHRDLHMSNVGMKDGKWLFFDFGMSIFNTFVPYNKDNSAFYLNNKIPSISHDERLFLFSWYKHVESNESYLKSNYIKIAKSNVSFWETKMPVVFRNHPCTENGYFLYEEEDGKLLIEMKVKTNTIKKRKISSTRVSTGRIEETTIHCSFKKEDVLPDLLYEFIHYYVPTLH